MTDLQGAIGTVQLKKLKSFIQERNKWAQFYINELKILDWLQTPTISDEYGHGWQSFVCMVDENKSPYSRNEIMKILEEKGISTRPGTHAVHMLGYYRSKYDIQVEQYPEAQKANDFSMAIPLHNSMEEDDFHYIVETLKSI